MATWHPRLTGEVAGPIEAALERLAESVDTEIAAAAAAPTSATINLTGNFSGSSITVYKLTFGSISLAFLDGLGLSASMPAAGTVIGNVPAGYRPFGVLKVMAGGSASSNSFRRILSVQSGGDIVFNEDIGGGSNIFFRGVPPWLVGN